MAQARALRSPGKKESAKILRIVPNLFWVTLAWTTIIIRMQYKNVV